MLCSALPVPPFSRLDRRSPLRRATDFNGPPGEPRVSVPNSTRLCQELDRRRGADSQSIRGGRPGRRVLFRSPQPYRLSAGNLWSIRQPLSCSPSLKPLDEVGLGRSRGVANRPPVGARKGPRQGRCPPLDRVPRRSGAPCYPGAVGSTSAYPTAGLCAPPEGNDSLRGSSLRRRRVGSR